MPSQKKCPDGNRGDHRRLAELGSAVARQLSERGDHVIVPARDLNKAKAAAAKWKKAPAPA
jgi:NAD(P)-dependent dehydrogenase (short-subunit alcohol dehydrogenase family)